MRQMDKERAREQHQRNWLKAGAHKNKKKYDRHDRRQNKKIDDGDT